MILKLYRTVATRFRSFANKQEMNEHVNAHIFAAGRKLHKNGRAVLNMIAKYSCIITGVSWLNDKTIAESIGVSPRTVKRAIERLIMLGIGRREVVEINGVTIHYFVINRFDLSALCPEIDSEVSTYESDMSLTAATDEVAFSNDETIEPIKPKEKDIVVVEAQLKAKPKDGKSIVHYPSAIIESLSRHGLKPNAATLKRWLSLANESTIIQAIDDGMMRKGVRNIIAWITGVLQQGYMPNCPATNRKPIKVDKVPDYVLQQGKKDYSGQITEAQRQEAAELLAALGEI